MEQASTYQYRVTTTDSGNLRLAFMLNLVFCIIELFGGLFTNSMAILADALHDLGDAFTLALALYFQRISQKNADGKFSYGYSRFSTLGSFFTGVILLVGSVFVLSATIPRIVNPVMPNTYGVLIFSLLGLAINGSAVMAVKRSEAPVDESIKLHLMEDVWGWVAVLVASILMMLYGWAILDALLALVVTGFTLYNAYGMLHSSTRIMLQGIPADVKESEIRSKILAIEHVNRVCDMHIWSLDGNNHVLTAKVMVSGLVHQMDVYELRNRIKAELLELSILHSTIEIESEYAPGSEGSGAS